MEKGKYCVNCGTSIDAQAEICPGCGVRQPSLRRPGKISRRVAAAIFAILLGSFGVHRFFLGQIGWGILYVLFCWTFIPAVAGLIEGILYLTMSEEEFETKYAR
ncbi:MAG: NINE protein [Candidatus Deferrimicrobiaceae bacterium]|jgi:TM2 domain-containing membrane protein YozV